MGEVKWIKVTTDIFDNRKIKLLEAMPDGDTIIVIWFKLMALAGSTNDNGYVYLTKNKPYTPEMLSTLFNRPVEIIRKALDCFEEFSMIEFEDENIYISNWDEYQNVDALERIREQGRLRVQRYRERKKKEKECNVTCNVTVTQSNALDKEEDIDINNKRESKKRKKSVAFSPPTVDQVKEYCIERHNSVDPERFVDFYSSKGWMVGKNHMKDWKAAVRNWEQRNKAAKNVRNFEPIRKTGWDIPCNDIVTPDLEALLLDN